MFLIFQVLSISFLVNYNKTYEAAYSNTAHSLTGDIQKKYNNIQYFFDLKSTNKKLAAENAALRTALSQYVRNADSLHLDNIYTLIDSANLDTTGAIRKYHYFEAKVVSNSLSNENNFITIEKGARQGVKKDMAVAGPSGIVGHVVAVSDNYSLVMSLLNHNSRVSGMLKKSFMPGLVEWDGKDPRFLTLSGIPKRTKVAKGDTVVTSNYSGNYPEGLMIGRVVTVSQEDPTSNYYQIRVLTGTDFRTLQYVYVIKNDYSNEQKQIEAKAQK
ncbi:rod shape-determining protein MreC [Arachidicoccus rhizosphaerae]|uniref:Cell shape-determining protein MreC n=2 Tax=Arachidicoccus rhizosphaerae TaxID=551991 RepID=A0A1H3XN40_9BACT|nr:rod shape-determining protein MreC [Arachidicoccus rhizosphaerae]